MEGRRVIVLSCVGSLIIRVVLQPSASPGSVQSVPAATAGEPCLYILSFLSVPGEDSQTTRSFSSVLQLNLIPS